VESHCPATGGSLLLVVPTLALLALSNTLRHRRVLSSHLLPVCQDAVKARGVCPRLAAGIPCFFKHAATPCMGVGGTTVPSPATSNSFETAFMVFLQQNAVDREADKQANEARDARMTELLGVHPAIYHDCDDDIHVCTC